MLKIKKVFYIFCLLVFVTGCTSSEYYSSSIDYVIQHLEELNGYFDDKDINIYVEQEDSKSLSDNLVIEQKDGWTYTFDRYGFDDATIIKRDSDNQEVDIQISKKGSGAIEEVRVGIHEEYSVGYNDYYVDDFSKPIYGPVTDDGNEAAWDKAIKSYVSEEELNNVITQVNEYLKLFDEIYANEYDESK